MILCHIVLKATRILLSLCLMLSYLLLFIPGYFPLFILSFSSVLIIILKNPEALWAKYVKKCQFTHLNAEEPRRTLWFKCVKHTYIYIQEAVHMRIHCGLKINICLKLNRLISVTIRTHLQF